MSEATDVEHYTPFHPPEVSEVASLPLESIKTPLITFKAEGHIVQLPVAPFIKHSSVFRDMFAISAGGSGVPQGGSDTDPIILQDSFHDIKALANYFNPELVLRLVEVVRDKVYFLSLLRLADKYDMKQVLDKSCIELHNHNLGILERLQLTSKFHLPLQWAKTAFHQLIEHQAPLLKRRT
ncbi:hypothetical protein DL96DRAFT_1739483 [Flagelloscypha sp. PMI_526]|nr:hypothetical protein DL96DRAFT_1739483 [Flagelloscypha sp. PMI_526]